ncbi:hypothetical protein LOAG_08877 [Loa loa]|uniref:TFIIIC_delta domain-containing protein n=1 Tax=Loa loa TaxID=7209 RepID=A0A1I7VTU8_LOALO|nr:hypothetical protein LOAG_08877 [Loa loa]EFO19616.1 hypothetical protein LOAG_08877 [Loa loa]
MACLNACSVDHFALVVVDTEWLLGQLSIVAFSVPVFSDGESSWEWIYLNPTLLKMSLKGSGEYIRIRLDGLTLAEVFEGHNAQCVLHVECRDEIGSKKGYQCNTFLSRN